MKNSIAKLIELDNAATKDAYLKTPIEKIIAEWEKLPVEVR